jgi:hypothetical protein
MLNLSEKIYTIHDDVACEVKIVALNVDFDNTKDAPCLEVVIKYLEGGIKGTYEKIKFATSSDVKGNILDHEITLRLHNWKFYKDEKQPKND